MKFSKIIVCLDMHGCPNRCKHCWLGASPNGNMIKEELTAAAKAFKPFTDCLEMDFWYREPDFSDDYKELYALSDSLSDTKKEHFELVSFWRLVRDKEYVKWLSEIGLKKAQLTIFGSEATTDFYVGRKGAYREILKAIDILLDNKISVRLQSFVTKNNIDELKETEKLIEELNLKRQCKAFGDEFTFFLHNGSCDGENEQFYEEWVTPAELKKNPPKLIDYTLKHFGKKDIKDVFGKTEKELYYELINDNSTADYTVDSPVFYIDGSFDVYPNITTPAPHWRLGNLKKDGAEKILQNYKNNKSIAQQMHFTVPICSIVRSEGDCTSERLFDREDYIELLLNRYCRKIK